MNRTTRKDGERQPGDRSPAADRQWRVLFIGDHGRVVTLKHIKTLIGLTLGVVATALITVAVLVMVNARLHARMHEAQEQLSAAQLQIQALRQERDLLTAHVVLAETKVKEALAGISRSAAVPKSDSTGATSRAIESRPAPQPEAPTEAQPASADPDGGGRLPAGIEESVAIEDFFAGVDASRRAINLRYKLVAQRSARKPLAGHVVVVFKSQDTEPERWLAMPSVDLPKGRPTGRQKGYTFSISHSKAFSQSLPVPASFPVYTQAVMYVFAMDGQLLMARDYGVDIKPAGG